MFEYPVHIRNPQMRIEQSNCGSRFDRLQLLSLVPFFLLLAPFSLIPSFSLLLFLLSFLLFLLVSSLVIFLLVSFPVIFLVFEIVDIYRLQTRLVSIQNLSAGTPIHSILEQGSIYGIEAWDPLKREASSVRMSSNAFSPKCLDIISKVGDSCSGRYQQDASRVVHLADS
ncbi:hypothetical protein CC78DRAFT_363761 [Lojkania enalia]|uniref:Uncharacterized protein n=1 Tax=Lojkania enalia TaxID=147567 RepID=A0A9P4MX75_9PLEO|nr:hypothetical protein CC78DRAFT_363761 [Didymosphaeria enalia]